MGDTTRQSSTITKTPFLLFLLSLPLLALLAVKLALLDRIFGALAAAAATAPAHAGERRAEAHREVAGHDQVKPPKAVRVDGRDLHKHIDNQPVLPVVVRRAHLERREDERDAQIIDQSQKDEADNGPKAKRVPLQADANAEVERLSNLEHKMVGSRRVKIDQF
jgi:hypothetical protein